MRQRDIVLAALVLCAGCEGTPELHHVERDIAVREVAPACECPATVVTHDACPEPETLVIEGDCEITIIEDTCEEVPEESACTQRPTFGVAPTAVPTDSVVDIPVLTFAVYPFCSALTAGVINLSLHRVESGYAPAQDICTVFDCDAQFRLTEHVTGHALAIMGGVSGALMGGTIADDGGATAFVVPREEERTFILFGNLRADAPPGRYRFHLDDVAFHDERDDVFHFPGFRAMGPEIVVPELTTCAPEVAEVGVRPPSFRMEDAPFVSDPSDRPGVSHNLMHVALSGGSIAYALTFIEITLARFGHLGDDAVYGSWGWAKPCDVVQCDTLEIVRLPEAAFSGMTIVESFDTERREDAVLTPSDWPGLALPVGEYLEQHLVMRGNVRADAPPGRYRFILRFANIAHDGTPSLLRGTPAYGPEFTVAEAEAEGDIEPSPLPWVRGHHLASVRDGEWEGGWIRLHLMEVNATPELPVAALHFRLQEIVGCGEKLTFLDAHADLCAVLDCATVRVSWLYAYEDLAVDGEVMLTDGALEYRGSRNIGFTLEDVAGIDRAEVLLTVVGRVRDDAPDGRYFLSMVAAYADPPAGRDVARGSVLLAGTEFDVGAGVQWNDPCTSDRLTAVADPEGF